MPLVYRMGKNFTLRLLSNTFFWLKYYNTKSNNGTYRPWSYLYVTYGMFPAKNEKTSKKGENEIVLQCFRGYFGVIDKFSRIISVQPVAADIACVVYE